MLFLRQKRIYREDLRANPNRLYIFGDNLDRQGLGGQAGEMRGEPNAFGIATLRHLTQSEKPLIRRLPIKDNVFIHDGDPDAYTILEAEFTRLNTEIERRMSDRSFDGIVYPLDGIGTGIAALDINAPILLKYINDSIDMLEEACKELEAHLLNI